MKAMRVLLLLVLVALLLSAGACTVDQSPPVTPTPEDTPTPVPTASSSCDQARDAIQVAIDAYHDRYGAWPTADGAAGDVDWSKLVPEFMEAAPANDSKCDWGVNSEPEGIVCVLHRC